MIKEIPFAGYTAQPSDYTAPDGTLAHSLNLLSEDGAIRPLFPPTTLFNAPKGYNAYIFFPPSGKKMFVFYKTFDNSTSIIFFNEDGKQISDIDISLGDKISSINAIGNTLIFFGESSMHYFLWKPMEQKFQSLGTSLPKVNVDFALRLHLKSRTFDSPISLVDSSQFQTGENAWEIIRSISLSGTSEYYHQGTGGEPHRSHEIVIKNINLVKGKEYRFTFNRQGNNRYGISLYFYSKPLPFNNCPADRWGKSYQEDFLYNIDKKSTQLTIIPQSDIENLYCYVFATWSDPIYFLPLSLTIEKGAENRVEINSKIISYTPESVNAVGAAMNVMINEEATGKNRFIYPFFVRYALRLFDGSNILPSAPRLMIPNSDYVPLVLFREAAPQLQSIAFIAELQYRINEISNLENWKDIITGIDIFISPPAYPYDESAEYDQNVGQFDYTPLTDTDIQSFGIGSFVHNNIEMSGGAQYKEFLMINARNNFDTTTYQPVSVRLGARSKEDFMKQFYSSSLSSFYNILSIDIKDIVISSEFQSLDIPDGTISSLVARPRLEESFIPYEGFANAKSHIYNNRLHIFDGSPILPTPQCLFTQNPYQIDTSAKISLQEIFVTLSTSEGEKVVKASIYDSLYDFTLEMTYWFFYPDSRATNVLFTFKSTQGTLKSLTLQLTAHPFLSGAYALVSSFYDSFGALTDIEEEELPTVNSSLSSRSSIYVSDTNNPFIFRNESTVTVGATRITALSSAARALSQGQFGQFPLYIFTDTGIWAMEISSTGAYIARQPISRDVVLNPESITQIDSAVLFATDRGIMHIAGSQVECISETIDSDFPFQPDTLPHLLRLSNVLSAQARSLNTSNPQQTILPFKDFLKSCRMAYDYINQRIYLYSTSHPYAYVYSLKSRSWGFVASSFAGSLNSYPEAYAIASDPDGNRIVDLSRPDTAAPCPALLLTRPLKLDGPDILKTVDTVITRGDFRRGHVKSILYGSRDLRTWHPVWSSVDHSLRGFRGSPYKYFRLALLCDLQPDESISSASFQFSPRYTNSLR